MSNAASTTSRGRERELATMADSIALLRLDRTALGRQQRGCAFRDDLLAWLESFRDEPAFGDCAPRADVAADKRLLAGPHIDPHRIFEPDERTFRQDNAVLALAQLELGLDETPCRQKFRRIAANDAE